jgi:hypothetical protein
MTVLDLQGIRLLEQTSAAIEARRAGNGQVPVSSLSISTTICLGSSGS